LNGSDEAFAGLLAKIKELEEKVNLIWTQEWVTMATGIGQVVPDDWWLGLGAAAGRIEWDNQATDEVNFLDCYVGIGTQTPGGMLHLYHATSDISMIIETDRVNGLAEIRLLNDAQSWYVRLTGADDFVVRDVTAGTNPFIVEEGCASGSLRVEPDGVAVNAAAATAQLHVDQSGAAAAKPVLHLDQADVDQVLMKIVGTASAASANRTLVDDGDFGTPGALVGWIQIEIDDEGNRIPDGDYYIPFYATPT